MRMSFGRLWKNLWCDGHHFEEGSRPTSRVEQMVQGPRVQWSRVQGFNGAGSKGSGSYCCRGRTDMPSKLSVKCHLGFSSPAREPDMTHPLSSEASMLDP